MLHLLVWGLRIMNTTFTNLEFTFYAYQLTGFSFLDWLLSLVLFVLLLAGGREINLMKLSWKEERALNLFSCLFFCFSFWLFLSIYSS